MLRERRCEEGSEEEKEGDREVMLSMYIMIFQVLNIKQTKNEGDEDRR